MGSIREGGSKENKHLPNLIFSVGNSPEIKNEEVGTVLWKRVGATQRDVLLVFISALVSVYRK